MNPQALAQLESNSEFQRAIDTIELLPIETQEALMTVIQNRLREKRRSALLESVTESENAYARGEVRRGNAADLLAELDD
jgi:FtsZ-binding cell division protein ZapB